jgi:hypothetical protein
VSDQKEEKRPLIEYAAAKPFVDAAVLATGCASVAVIPTVESQIIKAAAVGVSFSCFWFWGSGNLSRPKAKSAKRKQGRQIKVQGEPWSFDQVAPGQFITRQSVLKDILDFLLPHKQEPLQRQAQRKIDKPPWMQEVVFHSHCDFYPMQLAEPDVSRFLNWARRHQQRGKGLSARSWVRFGHERGAWYQALPRPQWYEAMMNLLDAAGKYGERQLVIEIGNQKKLARDTGEILEALRLLEGKRTQYDISTERGERLLSPKGKN